jgi:hypothetical protein
MIAIYPTQILEDKASLVIGSVRSAVLGATSRLVIFGIIASVAILSIIV